jgi:hypothetical protein
MVKKLEEMVAPGHEAEAWAIRVSHLYFFLHTPTTQPVQATKH